MSYYSVFIICMVLLFMIRLLYKVLTKRLSIQPKFYFKDTKLNDYLFKHCQTFKRPFSPPVWLQNRHVQTILPAILNRVLSHGIDFEREFITADDGEKVAMDWAILRGRDDKRKYKDIIILLPGMTASATSFSRTCLAAIQQGFRVGVFNKRGHGGTRITKPLLKGFGDSSDLQSVLKVIKSRYPDDRIALIGSSAGSALLASYCSNYVKDSLIHVCIHLSPGYETRKLFEYPPYSKFYEYILVQSLKHEIIWPNIDCLSSIIDKNKVKAARSMYELERDVYCKANGYKDMEEHWTYNNPDGSTWAKYTTPTLCLSGLDDPICVAANIPFTKFQQYDHGLLMTVEKGGHCGFIENCTGLHWSDLVMVDYIKNVLQFLEESRD